MNRRDELPVRFTDAEREAYCWLYDCNIRPWVVDLLTKNVKIADGVFQSLVEYAKHKGMQIAQPKEQA